MTVDPLRRQAGNRRPARFWDRGQWLCGALIALISIGLGLWALTAEHLGRDVESTVRSCSTELHLSGRFLRHVTTCEVSVKRIDGQPPTISVETSRPYPAGAPLTLVVFRDTYADATLNSNYVWLLPLGLAVAAGTWWMGFPSRVDLAYGRHAAPRKGR